MSFLIKICPLSVCCKSIHIFVFFSRITGPISTKLGTKHYWFKGIQVCSNAVPCLLYKKENVESLDYWNLLKFNKINIFLKFIIPRSRLGVTMGRGQIYLHIIYFKKSFNFFSKTYWSENCHDNLCGSILML